MVKEQNIDIFSYYVGYIVYFCVSIFLKKTLFRRNCHLGAYIYFNMDHKSYILSYACKKSGFRVL